MRRRSLPMLLIAMLACTSLPGPAAAAGQWSTFIRMRTCTDILALRDTVWYATGEAGLLRYSRSADQYEFVNRGPGGLASNTLTSLCYDRSGRLWVGTAGKGVSRLAANGLTWDLLNAFDGLPSDTITVLRAVGDSVWIGTARGITLWDGRQVAGSVPDLGTPSPFSSNVIRGIVQRGDSLFVATADGINVARLSQNLSTWSTVNAGLLGREVLSLATDGRDIVVMTLVGDLGRWDATGGTWQDISGIGCPMAMRDDFDRITAWSNQGLSVWSGTQWVLVPGSPAGDCSTKNLEFGSDPTGKVFASRNGDLIEQAAPSWITRTPPGPVGNDVQNIMTAGSRVWVNTYSAGVCRYDGAAWRSWTPGCCGLGQDSSFIGPSFAFMMQRDRQNRVWIANWETAIERIDASADPVFHFDHLFDVVGIPREDSLCRHTDGWASAMDSAGWIYVGGETPSRGDLEPMGIDVYDPNGTRVITWKTTNAGLGSNEVRALAVDRSGLIWAGYASQGVGWAAISTTDHTPGDATIDHLKLPHFTGIPALATTDIFAIVVHGDSVWVLTSSDLKRVRSSTRTVQSSLDVPAGPAPRGGVHPMDVATDGTVWVGTVDGVRRYSPGGGFEDFRVDNSPLADNEVRAISVEPASGVVWIGTASGVNRYDPHYRPPAPPRIPSLQFKIYPNPASLNAMGIELRLAGNTTGYSGEILDLGGRVVRRFESAANDQVIWDGRDGDGTLVRPGIYFVHARAGGREALKRVVVLR